MFEEEGGALGDVNDISHSYRDETWRKRSLEYDPPQRGFTGCGGLTFVRLFWPDTLLHKICTEAFVGCKFEGLFYHFHVDGLEETT